MELAPFAWSKSEVSELRVVMMLKWAILIASVAAMTVSFLAGNGVLDILVPWSIPVAWCLSEYTRIWWVGREARIQRRCSFDEKSLKWEDWFGRRKVSVGEVSWKSLRKLRVDYDVLKIEAKAQKDMWIPVSAFPSSEAREQFMTYAEAGVLPKRAPWELV